MGAQRTAAREFRGGNFLLSYWWDWRSFVTSLIMQWIALFLLGTVNYAARVNYASVWNIYGCWGWGVGFERANDLLEGD